MPQGNELYIIGYACDVASPIPGGQTAPAVLQYSPYLKALTAAGLAWRWQTTIQQQPVAGHKLQHVINQSRALAVAIQALVQDQKRFLVLGGDHTSAIGTWSGVQAANVEKKSLGLLWIDAHMDSHTPQTTVTGNIHGMPLACLLGYGEPGLTQLMFPGPVLTPAHVCLIGVRSFEAAEAELLARLKVRIYFIDEVKRRGLTTVISEAISYIAKTTDYFGVSLDLDVIDPSTAPAVAVPEPYGIKTADLVNALTIVAHDPRFIGAEIVEFTPQLDQQAKTEKIVAELIGAMFHP